MGGELKYKPIIPVKIVGGQGTWRRGPACGRHGELGGTSRGDDNRTKSLTGNYLPRRLDQASEDSYVD